MLSTVDSLTENINKIDEFIQQISSNHALIASQWANEEARKANEELHEKLKDLSHFVTDELKKMKRVLDRDQTGPDRNTADFRIRKAQYSTLSRRFRDVMLSYNQIEEEYRDKNKEKILRQIKIVNSSSNSEPEVSDEKLEELLDNDQLQAFTQSVSLPFISRLFDNPR
jgi:syntaxin 1A/syntaxin 1B/2/3